ncbi:hypothetical protein EDB86DRAFT_3099304 [Lactarius hatsudake]|nr:hypothetical protein EDB86DRAFT_3099304 [Lactarius hatsudake]
MVAILLTRSYDGLKLNSQDASAFYLSQIYQLSAGLNGTSTPLPFEVPAPSTFSPDPSYVRASALWSLSLVISLAGTVIATLLRQWARRYRRLTQEPRGPGKRARIRELTAQGVERLRLHWMSLVLPGLFHLSVLLFLYGLVHYSNNNVVDLVVLSSALICLGLYLFTSIISYFPFGSICHTPLSSFAWSWSSRIFWLTYKLLYNFSIRLPCIGARTRLHLFESARSHLGRASRDPGLNMEDLACQRSSFLDTSVVLRTFDTLGRHQDMVQFLSAIPGFYNSSWVKRDVPALEKLNGKRLAPAIATFMDNSLSSGVLTEFEKWERITICLRAINADPLLLQCTLRQTLQTLDSDIFRRIDFVRFALQHLRRDRPLTEGGAIMLMTQQLGGLYASNRNHPDKAYPESYYERLIALEVDKAQVDAATRERLILENIEVMRLDASAMAEIRQAVKDEIFANMNAEALQNIDDWRAIYKHEFTEAMHSAFEDQYPGIHPNKGKAKEAAPITHSQVVREAQPRIQEEVRLQVQARVANIHEEIKHSIANNDPFWGEGPLRDAIAEEIRTNTRTQVQKELGESIEALRIEAQDELDAYRAQVQFDQDKAHEALHAQAKQEYETAKSLFAANLEADIQEFKSTITSNVKEWKETFRTARNLTALRREARRFGCSVIPADEGSSTAEKNAFKKYTLTPLVVDGRDISAEPASPQGSQITTPSVTPPNRPHVLPDPNVTPTPTRVKRTRTEEPAPYPRITNDLFFPSPSPVPTPLAASIPLPSPMEEDFDYALEVRTDYLHKTGPGSAASIHAPTSGINHSSREHNPSAPPQGSPLDAQSEGKPTAPIPVSLPTESSPLEVPARAPQAQQTDPLAAILNAINATISGLEARLSDRLDAQDRRIQALSTLTAPSPPPPVKEKRAKGQATVAAVPGPNTRSIPSEAREVPAPVPRIDDPASHDRVEEIQTPGTRNADQTTYDPQPTVLREAFQPPPEKHVRLNVDAQGKPTPATSMPPSWANVVTKTATSQQNRNAGQAKEVTAGTFRSNAGKARPETVARRRLTGNTEATVIRHHGLEDIAFEMTVRKMTPASIINETRSEIDRLTGGKVVLLSGRWSANKNKNIHNFVYTFKGQIPFRTIYPLRDVLVKPLMTGHLVPNDGWTFAQIRDTTTSGHDGTVFSGSQLETELRRNPAFEDAIFCIAPHWQGSMNKISTNPRGTVKFAYVDEDGKITAQAKRDGVFLFNERTRFVPTGDVATIVLCGRCHRIGHTTDSTACPLPTNAVRCFICGGSHHSNDHVAHCPNQHDKVGECRCLFPCINCGGGHNARSPQCKLKMGFAPPDLAPPPNGSANIPPAPSAKGKAREVLTEDLVPTQREHAAPLPATEPAEPFTLVTKKSRNQRRRANVAAARTKGAATSGPSPTPATAPAATPTPSAGTDASTSTGRKTSTVPARPLKKFPTPPTWHEAPVIYRRHVATDQECAEALRRIFKHEPTTEELRSVHVAWGGHETDEEVTALWTLHFRWAVKYGLPLTTQAARGKIVYEGKYGVEETLKRFEEDWGPISPRNYLLSKIPREQYFSHPGDLEEEIISPETALHNRNMARTLVQTVLKFKSLEAKANNTAPPPPITEPIIEALLDAYSFQGTYSFFGLASAGADDGIWTALLDMHASSTAALTAYA